jgi:hypothetical protein
VKAATENLGFEKGLLEELIEGERNCTDPTLLLFVLLTVPIRDSVAGGRLVGFIGNRRGAGCCPPRLSDAIESRIPPSLLPALDIGGVIGIVAARLNFKGCGTSGLDGD